MSSSSSAKECVTTGMQTACVVPGYPRKLNYSGIGMGTLHPPVAAVDGSTTTYRRAPTRSVVEQVSQRDRRDLYTEQKN